MGTIAQHTTARNRLRWFSTIGYYLAFILLGMSSATTGPLLVDLAAQTGSQLSRLSVIFTTGSLGYFVGSSLGGRLYDRMPGHQLMTIGLFLLAVVTALVPAATSLWLLSGLFFLVNATAGMIDVGGNTLLVWAHGEKVGPFMNGLHFAYGIGATIAPLLVVPIVDWSGGIAWVYWTLALLSLPVAALLSRVPSPSAITESEGPSGKEADAFLVGLIAVFFFLYVGAQMGFGNWIATYAQVSTALDAAAAAYLTSAYWGLFTLGRLIAVPIATVLKPRRILWINLIGALASLLLIVVLPGATWALWVGSMGLGLSLASTFPTMFLLAETYLPMTGKLMSMFFIGISLGSMGLPWLIGQLFDRIRPNIAMGAVLADMLLATALYVALLVHTRRRSQQPTDSSDRECAIIKESNQTPSKSHTSEIS